MLYSLQDRLRSLARGGAVACLAGMTLGAAPALAGGWPPGPVQLVVPAKAGGGTDAVARIFGQALQQQTHTGFGVVNSPAGGGAVAAEQVRTSSPNGRALLFYHTGLLVTYHTGGYSHSPLTDFTTIADLRVGVTFSIVVPQDSPYKSIADLMSAAKAKPDSVTVGVQIRSSSQFMAGLLEADSGAQFRIVEAGSDADKLVAVEGHQIDAAIVNTPGAQQYVKKGDMHILATIGGTPDRDPAAPNIPSLYELGYKDAVYGVDFLVLGPKDMTPAEVQTINDDLRKALATPAVSKALEKMHLALTAMSVSDSVTRLKQDDVTIVKTAKQLGLM